MGGLHRDSEGRIWVRLRVHEEQLAAKDAEIAALKAENEQLKKQLAAANLGWV